MTKLPQLTPEMLVVRLVDYLVQKGTINEADLQRALAFQQEQREKNKTCLLGEALIQLKLIERIDLDQAVTEQIIQLRSALQMANRNLERRVEERTAELQKVLARLSELSQVKANFVSNVSHELRTPLTHIKGYLELLINKSLGAVTADQYNALEVCQRATSRLEGLVEDLIMFSLTSNGELSIKQVKMDLSALVYSTVKLAEEKAHERDVTVHAVVDKDIPFVKADPEKISWVISQLLDNGIKFTPAGGRVVVNVKRDIEKLVAVSVIDTGIGIAPERINEVFEPFHQLDDSSTRRYGGTGLGLSLVRQIIEAHGSMIDVHSTEGRGTTFRFPLLVVSE
jgi:signal transduction histidine kinase